MSFIKRKQILKTPTTFNILNKTYDLLEIGWDNEKTSKLWRYNQHYFDDLNAENSFYRMKWHEYLISNWIENNPVGVGTGWEPYPTSLRIVNWIKWSLKNNKHDKNILHSLVVQTRWLNKKRVAPSWKSLVCKCKSIDICRYFFLMVRKLKIG